MPPDVCSLVLAAGAGRRLSQLTSGVPKQFWRLSDGSSLLDHTLARLSPLVPARRTVTVVDCSHRAFVATLADPSRLGEIVFQPGDRGTAAGVLLGLLAITASFPEAVVVLTPSDHGVRRPEIYQEGLRRAIDATTRGDAPVVLLGVPASGPHGDYGWIVPGRSTVPYEPSHVVSFVEKPSAVRALDLWARRAVWNTMVLVARAESLLNLYKHQLPGLYAVLAPIPGLVPAERLSYLEAVYPTLAPRDFSRDLLTPARDLSLITWPEEIGWSDLGTPERLLAWHGGAPAARGTAPAAA